MSSYLDNKEKTNCCGCEACVQVCNFDAITMKEDAEGFRYPQIDLEKCVNCGKCKQVCQYNNNTPKNDSKQKCWGGSHKSQETLKESTSGGAFTAIVETWKEECVIFGAVSEKLDVYHTFVEDKKEIKSFKSSKYSQSRIGYVYSDVNKQLQSEKNVIFSGTPCQVAGLYNYLGKDYDNLLTVEVICEGVPSPLFIRKYIDKLEEERKAEVKSINYRFKDNNHWDFQKMKIVFEDNKEKIRARWINEFWNIWLEHLMSRPSCYECLYCTKERVADITMGDLWGVHLYCPDLYNKNKGASLIIANSDKGISALEKAKRKMNGHDLDLEKAVCYQGPLRKTIDLPKSRIEFMSDLSSNMVYDEIVKKWNKPHTKRFIVKKYIWGNRQNVFLYNLKRRIRGK